MKVESGKIVKILVLICVSIAFHFPLSTFHSLHAQYTVTRLGPQFNSPGSETGAIRVGDTVLAYSTMKRREASRKQFAFDDARMVVMQARIARSGKLSRPKPCRWGLNARRDHTGNLCIDPVSGDLYFTRARCGDEKLRCEIWTARKLRRGWDTPVRLRGDINVGTYTSTHPAIGRLPDGQVVLYYASDRPGGIGGMDIWYAIVNDAVCQTSVNLGPQVNTSSDEITPFYDQVNGVIYFSSDRPGGMGGHDIYCAVGQRNTWQQAEPTCACLNSPWNDIYFSATDHDPATGMPTAGYLSSNRPTPDDSTACCNDLYYWQLDSAEIENRKTETVADAQPDSASLSTLHSPLSTFMFPLFLYFHNDEPDRGSHEATTVTTYTDCQRSYAARRNEYLARQTSPADSAMMSMFFDTCVEGNYRRLEALFDYVEEQIDAGSRCTITVAGYASPLHSSDYNQTLSERRIASFVNMLRAWRGGILADAMEDGHLLLRRQPHGAVKPTTASLSADPVYGLPAAMARRIEIVSCEVTR